MALQQTEAPGGAGLQVLCPNCSRMHDAEEYAPACKRCGTEMKDQQAKDPVKLDPSKLPE